MLLFKEVKMNRFRQTAGSFAATHTIRKQKGFTLLEVMVVVVIIAVMAAAVGPAILGNLEKANFGRASVDIKTISTSLELYKAENYSYPSTDQGLEALVNKPSGDPEAKNWRQYIKKTPVDPWGEPYKYLSPGVRGDVDIYSFGPDKVQSDDDVGNWDAVN